MRLPHALLLSLIPGVFGLLGYDCGGTSLNVTTISLLDVGECHPPEGKVNATSTYIQLLQTAEYSRTEVMSCRVEIDRHIFYCGMHSHISLVQGGYRKYLVNMDQGTCNRLHRTRTFSYGAGNPVIDLTPNITNYRSLTLAGTIAVDGTCRGAQFSDPYGTWNDVVVEASLYITLRNYQASVKTAQDLLVLKSGVHCKASELECIDEDGANIYWAPIPADICKFHSYDVLYEGFATKIFDANSRHPIVYSITSDKTTFALARKSERSLCGYALVQTEHPKLIIVETSKDNPFAKHSEILVDNLDAFTYINSKFVYVEKHLKNQIQNLYQNIILQKCQLEQQILKNAVSLAQTQPDLFAYTLMKGPGYIATIAGEVAHVIKCVPTEVIRRSTEGCFLELPILLSNQSLFLAPKTHIIVQTGTPIECNPLIPIMYRLSGGWMSLTPKPAAVLPPQTLEPLTKTTWSYMDADHLAESGIYSTDDLNRLKEHIMFPVEQPSLMNNFARAVAGHRVPINGLSISNLIDNDAINIITESTIDRLFGGFVKFGTYTAGLIGIWLMIKIIKIIADTFIHGYALHSVYGWSIHLLGAVFASVTSLLLHLGRGPQQNHSNATGTRQRNRNQADNDNPVVIEMLDENTTEPQPASRNILKEEPVAGPSTVTPSLLTHSVYPQIAPDIAAINKSLSNLENRISCYIPQETVGKRAG